MKIVEFYGGLGNQLFQYAMLVAQRETTGDEVRMDTSLYATYNLHNGFELEKDFNITACKATKNQIKKLSWYTENYVLYRTLHYLMPERRHEFKERKYGKYYPGVFSRGGDCLFDGYWQHWEYFDRYRDLLLQEFSLQEGLDARNAEMLARMRGTNSCSVHVRRGDFLESRLYRNICEGDYYRRAIRLAKEKAGEDVQFYFFSNDFDWCRENLGDLVEENRLCRIDWNKGADSYKDMVLMSACRTNVIANSSFSWWAAYLNQNEGKTVIAPEIWINKSTDNPVQMPEWIRI